MWSVLTKGKIHPQANYSLAFCWFGKWTRKRYRLDRKKNIGVETDYGIFYEHCLHNYFVTDIQDIGRVLLLTIYGKCGISNLQSELYITTVNAILSRSIKLL